MKYLGILAAIIPMAANGIVRTLYNQTLDTFPAAEILLTASIMLVASALNFVLFTQNWRINAFQTSEETKTEDTQIEGNNGEAKSKQLESSTYF